MFQFLAKSQAGCRWGFLRHLRHRITTPAVLITNSVLITIAVIPQLICTPLLIAKTSDRPNIVVIIVDDLNDLPLSPAGKPSVPTPNIDRLAARGVSFTNAHTNDPICAPSRACMLFGLYPQTSGLFWFENWKQNGILNKSVSLNRHFQNNGYGVYGTGKIYHGGSDDGAFDQLGPRSDFGPWPWDGVSKQGFQPHPAMMYMYDTDGDMDYQWEHHFGPLSMVPDWPADKEDGVPGYKGWRLYGKPFRYISDQDRDLLSDERGAEWSSGIIEKEHEQPYVLFTGFNRTHTPLYAPQEYFDRFPLDSIELPSTIENDLEDCAEALADRSLYGFRRYEMLVRHTDRQLYKEWLQAYMACVSFVDDQVGKVLDAVERSPERDNTIVIFTSDHGFHIGEKQFLYKQSLWDAGTRIPMIVAGLEGMPQGVTCDQPISLIDVYPTLNDLCDLPREPNVDKSGYRLEGHSFRSLLMDPQGAWDGPDVAITALPGKDHSQHKLHGGTWFPHFSVRGKQHRYTLCASGEEELYDYSVDPLEFKNLADDPAYREVKSKLRKELIELRDGSKWKSLSGSDDMQISSEVELKLRQSGTIELSGESGFFLATVQKYRNFEFEFEAKTEMAARLELRYRAAIEDGRLIGSTANVPPTPSNLEGDPVEFVAGSWNRYRIRVVDDRCQIWINGKVHSDMTSPTASLAGLVGISFSNADSPQAAVKDLRMRRL